MKPTYGKTAYFINSYMVCNQGQIEGIMHESYVLNTGKESIAIPKESVFESKNEAIKAKITCLEQMIAEAKTVLQNTKPLPENAYTLGERRAKDALKYYPDAIEFLKSQLDSELDDWK